MDVDKMFKLPALPASAGQKRKFTDAPTPGKWIRTQQYGTWTEADELTLKRC